MSDDTRREMCLNGMWSFKSNVDNDWTEIRVPGSYAGVRLYWGKEHWDTFDYPERWQEKGGVYQRRFTVPAEIRDMPQIRFEMNGCYHHGEVVLNGTKAGEWHDGYAIHDWPVQDLLQNGENEIRIVVYDQESDFHDDYRQRTRGIWQDVFLKGYSDVVIERDAFVTTSVQDAKINVEVPLTNSSDAPREVLVSLSVTDADGRQVLAFDGGRRKVLPGVKEILDCSADWTDAHLWFPHDPYLHRLHITAADVDGGILDQHKIRFGFREITWDGPHLYLNGQELFLRGHGGHYQGDIQGMRKYMEAWLSSLKAVGVNFMRLHDSPKHACLYEVADELGMMLEGEPVHHFRVPEQTAIWQGHMEKLIKRYRNHPSVILWSVSNELRWNGGGEHPELIEFAKTLDCSRPVFSSDFSLESTAGDVLGHHYNPKTCFEEWEEFGPDKAMVWDELGSVWQHDRPLDNGTAGYECSSQDYATGCWYDGHDQILTDIEGVHDGKVFNGELHRVNAFAVWDYAYNFFRWQPINKNQPLLLEHETLDGPGIKNKVVKPCSVTLNPWDPTLPVFEPNPGCYIFSKYMQSVRFFDETTASTFWGGTVFSLSTRLFYEDLRPADRILCRVENESGAVLTEMVADVVVRPGQVVDDLELTFAVPEVEAPTAMKLVRVFVDGDREGYRHEQAIKTFPELSGDWFAGRTVGVIGSTELAPMLAQAGVDAGTLTAPDDSCDVLIVAGQEDLDLTDDIRDGARVVRLAAPPDAAGVSPEYLIEEKFLSDDDIVFEGEGRAVVSNNTGLAWNGWAPAGSRVECRTIEALVSNENSRLVFEGTAETGSYAWTAFERDGEPFKLLDLNAAEVAIAYMSTFEDEELDRGERDDRDKLERSIGLLMRDRNGQWYSSTPESAITLTRVDTYESERIVIRPGELAWEAVEHESGAGPQGALRVDSAAARPDWSEVTGCGIVLQEMPYIPLALWINRFVMRGKAFPSARIPLHGPKHRLLDGIDQEDLTNWREGNCETTVPIPTAGNYRVVLAGNKDGDDAALLEQFAGSGICLSASLNVLRDLADEPAAMWMLRNLVNYVADYRPTAAVKTAVIGDAGFAGCFEALGLQTGPAENANCFVVDARALGEQASRIRAAVENGGGALVHGVTDDTLAIVKEMVGMDLAVTVPYLEERTHCVKAATSWTRSDSPKDLVEYYDGILTHQPFEPNYDPLISGIANADLDWDGVPMFDQGIEIPGMDPVDAGEDRNILISNWRIDWSKCDFGGEYSHEGRDRRRADWFINRDPVLLKVKCGKGYFLLCQLHLPAGGVKGRRVASQLLTAMGCALGGANQLPKNEDVFDLTARADQLRRFAATRGLTAPGKRVYYGIPEHVKNRKEVKTDEKIRLLLMGDALLHQYADVAVAAMRDTHEITYVREPVGSTKDLLGRLQEVLAAGDYQTIAFSTDWADLSRSVEDFAADLTEAVKQIKATGAKAYWMNIPPMPGDAGKAAAYNQAALPIMDEYDVYTVDLYDFLQSRCADFMAGDRTELSAVDRQKVGDQVAQAIIFFGAQQ